MFYLQRLFTHLSMSWGFLGILCILSMVLSCSGSQCQKNGDCQFGMHCKSGQCVPELKKGSCRRASDCTGKQRCLDQKCVEGLCEEGKSEPCYTGPNSTPGVGECAAGIRTCLQGVWTTCIKEVLPTKEVCGDNKDNDCDGKTDEDCGSCQDGQKRACFSGAESTRGKGICIDGQQICLKGLWSSCTGEVIATKEVCGDSKDNDCDGLTDEDCGACKDGEKRACYTGDAPTKGKGVCVEGSQECKGGKWDVCVGEIVPSGEVCGDKKDNDCDGQTDEGCGACKDGEKRACYTGRTSSRGKGICRDGVELCSGGKWGTCSGQTLPVREVCGDKKDNDCDGQTDENCGVCKDGEKRACYTGPSGTRGKGICRDGQEVCSSGKWQPCKGDVKPSTETCNDKKDNDCDGQADEGCQQNVPPLDLKKVTWLHTNVSGWKETAKLRSVTFKGSNICLNHTHASKWPVKSFPVAVSANPWVFIYHNKRWYGATWEWMRPGQTCKAIKSVAGDHIKRSPFDAASGWRPTKGQTLYFMVSGLARDKNRNAMERSNVVKVVWP